jgi:hypothetical protein
VRTRPACGRLARELERGPLLRELDGAAGAVRGELGLECRDLRFERAEAREVRRARVLGRSAAACRREARKEAHGVGPREPRGGGCGADVRELCGGRGLHGLRGGEPVLDLGAAHISTVSVAAARQDGCMRTRMPRWEG